VPAGTQYVEAFKLEQRLDEWHAHRFGLSIAMPPDRIAIGASHPFSYIYSEDGLPGLVVTYSRDGSIFRPLGILSRRTKAPVTVASCGARAAAGVLRMLRSALDPSG